MSYCRFSSDNYRSDVYVYAVEDGVNIHVAGRRLARPGEVPAAPELADLDPDDAAACQRFADAINAQAQHLQSAVMVAIGLPHAGDCYCVETPGQAAAFLRELSALGYHVPAGVADALELEQAQLEKHA